MSYSVHIGLPLHPITSLLRRPLIGALAALTGTAAACDSCGCHLPPELGDPHAGLSLGVFAQYTDFSTLREEGREIGNPHGQWLHSSTTQVIASWRFTDAYALTLFVPYISRSFKRPNDGVEETGNVAGLGDASLLGAARLWHVQNGDNAASFTVRAGVKAPTGDPGQLQSERDGGGDEDPDNAVGGHDLALGSGSWDAVGGATAIGRLDDWYGVAQVLATWHSEGAYQYRMANEIGATISAGRYLWQEGSSHVAVQLNLEGESKGADTVAGERTDDTANHNLFIGPEVAARVDGRWSGILAVDVPISERNSAVQLVTRSFRFDWPLLCSAPTSDLANRRPVVQPARLGGGMAVKTDDRGAHHGTSPLERRDRLRHRHHPGAAVQRGARARRPLPPDQPQGPPPHPLQEVHRGRRRGGRGR